MIGYLIQSPVEYYANQTPNHAALSMAGEELSYSSLDLAANQLANSLIANGIKPQQHVGIFLHKCLNLGVAIYGALKAGCVFVPLDPFTPPDRLKFILEDCDIKHLVSSDVQIRTLKSLDLQKQLYIYGVDGETNFTQTNWSDIKQYPQTQPTLDIIDQDLGYIMYTSGSTGFPKGMMHTHHGSVSYARWGAAHVKLNSSDRVASHAPLHFDLSIFDFFSTAQSGATVVLVPEPVTRLPASWSKYVEDERISVVFTVPYTLITMLENGAMEKRDLSSLRWIMFGGEPFPPRQLRRLMQALEGVTFTNVYGPAEAPSCTCYDIPSPPLNDDEPLPIGIVSRNSEDIIIDSEGNDCKIDEPGELCIRSSTLTRGYWNRDDLSDKAFLTRPSSGHFPKVYYRTGDRVVRYQDGLLRFLGRMDRMVKTRGQRVELDEIEAVIATHEGVSEVAAFTIPDDFGSNSIIAAVTLNTNASLNNDVSTSDLILLAKSQLPQYAVPTEIAVVEQLPHTSTGKIDRRNLSESWKRNRVTQPETK